MGWTVYLLSDKTFFWDPRSLLLYGYRDRILKRLGRDADCTHASSAEIKNEWSYTSTPPIRLDDVRRDHFSFRSKSFAASNSLKPQISVQ